MHCTYQNLEEVIKIIFNMFSPDHTYIIIFSVML